jgi:hypothetical protein
MLTRRANKRRFSGGIELRSGVLTGAHNCIVGQAIRKIQAESALFRSQSGDDVRRAGNLGLNPVTMSKVI